MHVAISMPFWVTVFMSGVNAIDGHSAYFKFV